MIRNINPEFGDGVTFDDVTEALPKTANTEILHLCDGPLTPFVLIYRACELLRRSPDYSPDAVANALYGELSERGWVVDGDTLGESCGS